jgi:hypothetical protein
MPTSLLPTLPRKEQRRAFQAPPMNSIMTGPMLLVGLVCNRESIQEYQNRAAEQEEKSHQTAYPV